MVLQCRECKNSFEEGYCKSCFLKIQGELMAKVMESTVQYQVSELQTKIWDLEDKINESNILIKELLEEIRAFKIRGLKLKATKNS